MNENHTDEGQQTAPQNNSTQFSSPPPIYPSEDGYAMPSNYAQQPPYTGQQPQVSFSQPTTGIGGVSVPVSSRSKIAAAILAFFLGTFGIHNFYLGKTGRGVAQMLITILSFGLLSVISYVWAVIEGVFILTAKPGDPYSYDGEGFVMQQ